MILYPIALPPEYISRLRVHGEARAYASISNSKRLQFSVENDFFREKLTRMRVSRDRTRMFSRMTSV